MSFNDKIIDIWAQSEQSKKNLEDAELQAERERQIQATMPVGQVENKRKRKQSVDAAKSEFSDPNSLFSKYQCTEPLAHFTFLLSFII